jgi:hypothetical protein
MDKLPTEMEDVAGLSDLKMPISKHQFLIWRMVPYNKPKGDSAIFFSVFNLCEERENLKKYIKNYYYF